MSRSGFAIRVGLPPRDIIDCTKLAEELGDESAWVAEEHGSDSWHLVSLHGCEQEDFLGTSISSVLVRSIG
jgi:hypothetical protein